jgi:DNA replication and repair protein RecF
VGLASLDLVDFRSFPAAQFSPDPDGTTVLLAPNGTGKTSILEAIGYLGTARSFRGAPREVMIRNGADDAYVRATIRRSDTDVLIESQLSRHGHSRIRVNRQPAKTRRDLAEAVAVTTFAPEDVSVVRGAPAQRRDVLDDALLLLEPTAGHLLEDTARVLRQRGALLRQLHGRLTASNATTLDVWDERLAELGDELASSRDALTVELSPRIAELYRSLAGDAGEANVTASYSRSWVGPLRAALAAARGDDVRRGVSTIGPHRDDVALTIEGRDARAQASQGEQRSLALAIRIAVHAAATAARGEPPLLLLDDVFSELDLGRAARLLELLPRGQTLLTTAVPPPAGLSDADLVDVRKLHRDP